VRERWEQLRALYDGLAPRERLAVAGVGAALACLLVYAAAVSPFLRFQARAHERAATASQNLGAVTELRKRYDEVNGRLAIVEQGIRQAPRGNIFTTLESLAQQSAVKVESMEPQTTPASDSYRETRVELTLKGVTLAQMVTYLQRIEAAPQMLSIKSLRIKSRPDKPELLDVSFSVSSFEPV
jgi:type II secretory pathway component PulM